MIFTCSNCSTRFYVDSGSFGAAPRKVRCGNCGYTWVQGPMDNDAEASAGVAGGTGLAAAAPAGAERGWDGGGDGVRWGALAGWFVFVFAVGALVFGAYQYRERVVSEWPKAARLYSMVGIEVATASAYGLELRLHEDQVRRGEENGTPVVFISGYVRNTSGMEKDIPPVRLMLLNGSGAVVQELLFEVDTDVLEAGGQAPFEARVADPDPDATEIKLAFDLE